MLEEIELQKAVSSCRGAHTCQVELVPEKLTDKESRIDSVTAALPVSSC